MIRVDLGKDELSKPQKKSARQYFAELQTKLKIGNAAAGGGGASSIASLKNDFASLTMFGVVFVFSILPYLFVSQYKGFVTAQHARGLAQLKAEVAAMDIELDKLRPFEKEQESYEQQKKLVAERLAVVNRLLASRSAPVQVLDAISQSLPGRVWITSLEFKLSQKPGMIKLDGGAYAHEEISDFAEKLADSVYLTDVSMEDVGTQNANGIDIKNFVVKLAPKDNIRDTPIIAVGTTPSAATPPGIPGGED